MKTKIIFTIFLYFLDQGNYQMLIRTYFNNLIFFQAHSVDETRCDQSWEPFKEEKCFKIFNKLGLKNYEESLQFCKDNNSTLITIQIKQEQDFISEFLKNKKVSNDAWIGVKYTNKRYEWNDGTDVVYKNWAPGSPKQKDNHCVQFDLSDETFSGIVV